MRTITKTFLIIFSLIVFFCCTSEDACENIICLNESTCNNGSCNCILGYEGSTCDVEAKAKFIGTYILDSQTCGDFESPIQIIEVVNSLTELTQIIESNNGGTFEISVSLDSANSFTNSGGSIKSVYMNETLIVTISGCVGTYSKQ